MSEENAKETNNYIYILKINNTLEYCFDNLNEALHFIANAIDSEVKFNNYEIHQEEVDI